MTEKMCRMYARSLVTGALVVALALAPRCWAAGAVVTVTGLDAGLPTVDMEGFISQQVYDPPAESVEIYGTWNDPNGSSGDGGTVMSGCLMQSGYAMLAEPGGDLEQPIAYVFAEWSTDADPQQIYMWVYPDSGGQLFTAPWSWPGVPETDGLLDLTDAFHVSPTDSTPMALAEGIQILVASDVSAVPEPATLVIWSLLGALGVSIGWWRRRKAA